MSACFATEFSTLCKNTSHFAHRSFPQGARGATHVDVLQDSGRLTSLKCGARVRVQAKSIAKRYLEIGLR